MVAVALVAIVVLLLLPSWSIAGDGNGGGDHRWQPWVDSLYTIVVGLFDRSPEPEPFVPLPLVDHHPAARCLRQSPDVLAQTVASSNWQAVRRSLERYVVDDRLDVLTAFHVNSPHCAAVLLLDNNDTLTLLEPRVVGYNERDVVYHAESSTRCPTKTFYPERSRQIWVRYRDERSIDPIYQEFVDREAMALQSAVAYLAGRTICDNSDSGLALLHELINEPRELPAAQRHQAARPPSAPATVAATGTT